MNSRFDPQKDLNEGAVFNIPGVSDFISYIRSHMDEDYIIVGDYDTDGITATAVMKLGLEQYFRLCGLNKSVSYRIPKRFSEGYGITEPVIADILDNMTVITVDNGIAAIEEIKTLKNKGNKVLVTDHHLPALIDGNPVLPDADILIDPHVYGDGFEDYCGAGIAYKIMQELLPENDPVLPLLNAYAAIGTVADVVPIVKENWVIVKKGLEVLNGKRGIMTRGLREIINRLGYSKKEIESDTVGYYIAPALAAASRLSDTGANKSLQAIIDNSRDKAVERADELIRENDRRKSIVDSEIKKAEEELAGQDIRFPIILYLKTGEGIIGLIAGKLCEKYHGPVIIFTDDSSDPDQIKGSARSPKNCHIKELLDRHSQLILRYGGHAGAAGCTIKRSDFESFRSEMQEDLKDYRAQNVSYYDLDLDPANAFNWAKELDRYKPFGQDNEKPVFRLEIPDGANVRFMGENHLKFQMKQMDVVAFNQRDKYDENISDPHITAYGELMINEYKGFLSAQLKADDIVIK